MDERKARLDQLVRQGSRFTYSYDFGDDWEHLIKVEKAYAEAPEPPPTLCLAGKRAGPPEDCGGPWGYAELLDKLADPKHEEHAEMLEWVGGFFDPEGFDSNAINRELKRLDLSLTKPAPRKGKAASPRKARK